MNWSDQAEEIVKAWTEVQKKMWANWYDLAQAAPASSPFNAGLTDQWRQMATQGFEAWLTSAEPTAKDVAQRFFASQEALMRFLEFSTKAWQAIATKLERGEDWQSAMAGYTDQLLTQLVQSPEKVFQATQDSAELWRLYLEEMQKLTLPWLTSLQKTPGHFGQASTANSSALLELANLYWDAYERTLGRFFESPTLGYTRELNEKILKGFDAWQNFRQANFEYQVMLAEGWAQAFERFIQELVSLAEKGETVQGLRQLILLWSEVSDSVFIDEVFRSEKFIHTQGRLLNATMNYRIRQRDIVELFLKSNDIPTRNEVDEAHRRIYEQRKEIKALKKSLADLSAAMEGVSQTDDRPTRGELDESRQTIKTLRAEVKALKKTLADVTTTKEADDSPSRSELEQAHQSIESLRQEVKALAKTLAEVSTPAKKVSKQTSRANRPSTKRKKSVAKAIAVPPENNNEEGSQDAPVSNSNPA